MFERFTIAARETVVRAREEARAAQAPQIGTEHLLLALLDDRARAAYPVLTAAGLSHDAVRAQIARQATPAPGTLTDEDADALRTIGIDLDAVLARVTETFGPDALAPTAPAGRRWGRRGTTANRFTPHARTALGVALREAIRLGTRHIDDGHLLLGLLRTRCTAARILADAGSTPAQLRAAIEQTYRAAA
jgi:ATP-dependent Clp protease ATP-binding subunit ClpA